jgi:hypothetical protein
VAVEAEEQIVALLAQAARQLEGLVALTLLGRTLLPLIAVLVAEARAAALLTQVMVRLVL